MPRRDGTTVGVSREHFVMSRLLGLGFNVAKPAIRTWGRIAWALARLGYAGPGAWKVQTYRTPSDPDDSYHQRKTGAKFTHLPTASQWGVVAVEPTGQQVWRQSPRGLRSAVMAEFNRMDAA